MPADPINHMVDEASVQQLYRDLFKVANKIGAKSAKGDQLRTMIRAEFRKNMDIADDNKIRELKLSAVNIIRNYLVHDAASKIQEQRATEKARRDPATKAKSDQDEEGDR